MNDAFAEQTSEPATGIAARAIRAMAVVVAVSFAAVPLAVTPGLQDVFVLIKELAVRSEALIAAVLLTVAVAFGGTARLREMARDRMVMILLAGAVAWTILTALTSTNRLLSGGSIVTVVAAALVFLLVWYAAPNVPASALYVLTAVAAIETVLIALQAYGIWQPFSLAHDDLMSFTATIGNPNMVGTYLAIVTVILGAAAMAHAGAARWVFAAGAVMAFAGVTVSLTRTAMIAVAATVVIVAIRWSWKYAAIAMVLVGAIFAAAVVMEARPARRLMLIASHVAAGEWSAAASDRLPAFLVAVDMFRDRPFVGQGPNTYTFHFMEYRRFLTTHYPPALMAGSTSTAFADTHNDHLQLLAESGLPGYALFVAVLGALALTRVRRDAADVRARLATMLGLPFAVSIFLLSLAQFPLQIAVTRHLLVTVAALLAGWRRL